MRLRRGVMTDSRTLRGKVSKGVKEVPIGAGEPDMVEKEMDGMTRRVDKDGEGGVEVACISSHTVVGTMYVASMHSRGTACAMATVRAARAAE